MTWEDWLIVSVTLHYAAATAVFAWKNNLWMAWVYAGYAFINIGLIKIAQIARQV